MEVLKNIALFGTTFVGLALGLLFYFQEKLLYFPNVPEDSRRNVEKPERYFSNMKSEDVFITCEDGIKIHAFFVPTNALESPSIAPTVIYFHGNAGNIAHRIPTIPTWRTSARCNVLMVEYRGYGRSEGSPSEHGLMKDARAALNYAFSRPDVHKERIFVFGRSLGGAVALHIASDEKFADRIAGVIIENTFTSVPDMVTVLYPILSWARPLVSLRWESINHTHKIKAPILFVSGLNDELVPPSMMQKLYDAATSSKKREIVRFEGGTHMGTYMMPGYDQCISGFVWHVILNDFPREDN